jgi:acetyl-CoA carboxylase biotin carboxyl carrier protein
MSLRYDEIAEILKIIDGSACEELILEIGEVKLVVRRGGAGCAQSIAASGESSAPMRASVLPGTPSSVASPQPASSTLAQTPAASEEINRHPGQSEVAAPMVGTFYRAPSPDTPPFVEIGSFVQKGQPLCLIEVMKLFTTIFAEHDGRVVQIGADNGELVEYGRMLFVLESA